MAEPNPSVEQVEVPPAPATASDAAVSLLDGEAPAAATQDPPQPAAEGAKAEGEGETPAPETSLLDDDEGEQSPDKADGPADAKKDDKAPEYQSFTLPDGIEIDEQTLAKATPIFADLKLNQDQAQTLVSFYAEQTASLIKAAQDETNASFAKLKSEWAEATRSHPELGGDKLKASRVAANRAIEQLSTSPEEARELKSMLSEWGLANHPLVFGLLARAGAKLSDDTLVHSEAAPQARAKSLAERLYPNMPGDNA